MITDLLEERKDGKTIIEESPSGSGHFKSSGSNGVVERGVQEIEGGIRAILSGLEARMGRSIDARERIIGLIPEYVAYLMNRLTKGEDGKSLYERMKGKP